MTAAMVLKQKRTVDDIWPMKNKKVLIRVDFNVPIKNGIISNDYRIRSSLPTIKRVIEQGGSAILMSHLGRPKGLKYEAVDRNIDFLCPSFKTSFDVELSLEPVAERLEELLDCKVLFAPNCLDADSFARELQPGEVLLLENVRFYSNEGSKDLEQRLNMARKLATYADYFVR